MIWVMTWLSAGENAGTSEIEPGANVNVNEEEPLLKRVICKRNA